MFLQRLFRRAGLLPRRAITPTKTLYSTKPSEESLDRYTTGGYHPVRIGDLFKDGTYRVVNKLGYGQYSTVWLAYDTRNNRHVAMKVLTADALDKDHPIFELDILHKLSLSTGSVEAREPSHDHILHLLDDFNHEGPNGVHTCLVFKAMGPDLSKYRKLFPDLKIPVPIVKRITRQLLLALSVLHDKYHVIHCDIKPQNIITETAEVDEMFNHAPSDLFTPDSKSEPPNDFYLRSVHYTSGHEDIKTSTNLDIRLTDFGTSSWYDKHLTEWIQPEKLRAPEVILGASWDWRVDIWNLGALIWELVEAKYAFDGTAHPGSPYTAEAHFGQMQAVLGNIPKTLLDRGKYTPRYFDGEGNLLVPSPFSGLSFDGFSEYKDSDRKEYLDFILSMLQLDPEKRPSASALLESPWLCN